MTELKTAFLETSAAEKVESLPLSHVSVEVGHLYMEDFVEGEGAVRRTFAAAAPWLQTAQTPQAVGCEKKSVRVSTCFLIDDYFSRFASPAEVLPMVLAAAEREGVQIDYLARESACAGWPPSSFWLSMTSTSSLRSTRGSKSNTPSPRKSPASIWWPPSSQSRVAHPITSWGCLPESPPTGPKSSASPPPGEASRFRPGSTPKRLPLTDR